MLTDVKLRQATPGTKTGRLHDTGGLYLEIAPSGSRLRRLKYRIGGRARRLALGRLPRRLAPRACTRTYRTGAREVRRPDAELRGAHAALAAEVGHLRPFPVLLEDGRNLAVAATAPSYRTLRRSAWRASASASGDFSGGLRGHRFTTGVAGARVSTRSPRRPSEESGRSRHSRANGRWPG